MRLKLHTVEQARGGIYSLPVCIARTPAVGDSPQAALPGWSLGADEVEGFNEGAWSAGADLLEKRWPDEVELGRPGS